MGCVPKDTMINKQSRPGGPILVLQVEVWTLFALLAHPLGAVGYRQPPCHHSLIQPGAFAETYLGSTGSTRRPTLSAFPFLAFLSNTTLSLTNPLKSYRVELGSEPQSNI